MGSITFGDTSLIPYEITSSAEVSSAGDLVKSKFEAANTKALEAFGDAMSFLDSLQGLTLNLDWDEPNFEPVATMGLESVTAGPPDSVTIDDIIYEPATFEGTRPDTSGLGGITVSNDPVPTYSPPNLNFTIPPAPDGIIWEEFDKEADPPSNIVIPQNPDPDIPPVPILDEFSVPPPPSYSNITFDEIPPVEDLTPPDGSFDWHEEAYEHKVLTKLEDALYDSLVNGGSGLPEATEQAIYDRARSRLDEEAQKFLESSLEGSAARGFPLPPGALDMIMLETHNKVLRSDEDLENDILIQQSKLAQENDQFAKKLSHELIQTLITHHSNVQARSLDAAKYVLEYALHAYVAKIEGFKARVSIYAVLAQVYEARIRGEIAKAELYKAQIAGITAIGELQATRMRIYLGQVAVVEALISAYKTEMEAANIQAQIDVSKIQRYATEVQAFAEKNRANVYRYEGYKAELSAEAIKADILSSYAQGYTAQVTGFKAKADVDVARAQVELEKIRGFVSVYQADVMKYSEDVKAAIAQLEADVAVEELDLKGIQTQAQVYQTELDALTKTYYGKIEEHKANADIEAKAADVAVRALLGKYQLLVEALKGSAAVAGQLAAASMGSVNASAALSHNEARSDTRGYTGSESVASVNTGYVNEQKIEQHMYYHTVES